MIFLLHPYLQPELFTCRTSFEYFPSVPSSTMSAEQLAYQIHAVAKPTMYLLLSLLTFYLTVTCYLGSRFSKLVLNIILVIFTSLSLANVHNLVHPLDMMWGLMMTVWISHSASLLWFEQSLLESVLDGKGCVRSVSCCCPSHVILRSLWYD